MRTQAEQPSALKKGQNRQNGRPKNKKEAPRSTLLLQKHPSLI